VSIAPLWGRLALVSTAMNVIGCLDRPTDGHYYLDKVDVAELGDLS